MLIGYVYVLISLTVLILTFLMDERSSLVRIMNTVVFLNFGWIGIEKIRNSKYDRSLEINTEIIRFNQQFNLRKYTEILWEDIQWIKREKNHSIHFLQGSSVSTLLELKDFTEEEREKILEELQNQAHQRSIRLINFSESLSASV